MSSRGLPYGWKNPDVWAMGFFLLLLLAATVVVLKAWWL